MLNRHRGLLFIRDDLTHMCDNPGILILNKIQRCLSGMFPCIFKKQHTDLIQQHKCRTLDSEADKEGQQSRHHHDDRRRSIITAFDRFDRLHDNIITGKDRSQYQQQDTGKIRHINDQ